MQKLKPSWRMLIVHLEVQWFALCAGSSAAGKWGDISKLSAMFDTLYEWPDIGVWACSDSPTVSVVSTRTYFVNNDGQYSTYTNSLSCWEFNFQ